jgi:cytochrome o ubiquinol oxidase subunit 1
MGFALVWHIWWLAALGLALIPGALIVRAFVCETERVIPAAEVARAHDAWLDAIARADGVTRDVETGTANRGLAAPDE